MSSNRLLAH